MRIMFAYVKLRNGSRKAISLDAAFRLQSVLEKKTAPTEQQKQFLKRLDKLVITKPDNQPKPQPVIDAWWQRI